MRSMVVAGLLIVGFMGSGAAVDAHHAFAAEFDAKRPVHLKGILTGMEWVNPHSWLHVDVKNPDGTTESWMIEAGTPNSLFRRGITRQTLTVGVEIVIDGYQAKSGARRANGRDITFPDGRKFFLSSSSSEGAPPRPE